MGNPKVKVGGTAAPERCDKCGKVMERSQRRRYTASGGKFHTVCARALEGGDRPMVVFDPGGLLEEAAW